MNASMLNDAHDLYAHWHLRRDADGIATLVLDRAGCSTNALSGEVLAELATLLDALESDPPAGLIIRSGKPAGFIAGADITEFSDQDTPEKARRLVARGWGLFNRLAAAGYPTLALIRGHCLGGGLELALACRYRVVVDEPGTRLGQPEVMLGIMPCWGGMLRLPALIGPQAALDMMLGGRPVDARKAARLGLADLCVPPRVMEAAARELLLSGRPQSHARGFAGWLQRWPLRTAVAALARRRLAAKAPQEHYPAPWGIVELWEKHGGNALDAPHVLDRILASDTSRNLLRVFQLQERLKSFAKGCDAPGIRRVHVVGAGVMGGDIAAWCALKGMTVSLQDRDLASIAPALKRAARLFQRRLRNPLEARAAADRLIPDPSGAGVAHADLVIEAIFENAEAKRELYRSIEPHLKPDAVLATNTSSLRLEDLRDALESPERLVGIHFFNPVDKMPLVEVVHAEGASSEMLKRACAFVGQIDKLPLPVKSAPGFLVNAVLAPYMQEAMRCVDEGIAPETVDAAMLSFGMPMGPLELADTVGLDIALAAGRQLADDAEPPRCLLVLTERGQLGKKSGRGFYAWSGGKPARPKASGTIPPGLADRLVRPMLERTAKLVSTGIVADTDLADAGVIFGTGFAPFTGGPLHYRRTRPQTL